MQAIAMATRGIITQRVASPSSGGHGAIIRKVEDEPRPLIQIRKVKLSHSKNELAEIYVKSVSLVD